MREYTIILRFRGEEVEFNGVAENENDAIMKAFKAAKEDYGAEACETVRVIAN